MSIKVFIDGSSGTTGLRIADRLAARPEIELLSISAEGRKDVNERAKVINSADLAFLCLPDAASREVIPLVDEKVKILDTSTAFRTAPGWVYGFPELRGQREKIKTANRVAVPGCHATGFITLAAPLVSMGIAAPDYPFTAHSVTGYSGGGKSMIAAYEAEDRPGTYDSPRQYALGQKHKHLPEMQKIAGLAYPPVFNPIVADYFSGMVVTVPLHTRLLQKPMTPEDLTKAFADYYGGQRFIHVMPYGQLPEDGTMDANSLAGTNDLEIYIVGTAEQIVSISRFDNLGKGASGAAVQCMNLMLGLPEDTGL